MEFREEYSFLSNFYPSRIRIMGLIFPCIENAFQACKCINYEDVVKFTNITPSQAKALGRRIKLRQNWEDLKVEYMYRLLKIKFSDYDLKHKLISTGDIELVEDNNWGDKFWGRCGGIGENNLGKLLMKVREELKRENLNDWI